VEDAHAALRESVRYRLISDVPLGVFLSGGVDSSAVAVMAAEELERGLRTFTITFPGTRYDESKYARAVAQAINARHTEVPIDPAQFRELLPAALEHMDQPTFDYVNSYLVSRAVREAGITVALAGVGGDELFGGYGSFRDVPRGAQAARVLAWMPEWMLRGLAGAAARAEEPGHVPRQTRWGKLGDVLAAREGLLQSYQVQYSLFTQSLQRQLAPELGATTVYGLGAERARQLQELIRGLPGLHAVSLLELSCFVGERLLRDIDAASMAVALEVRVPLLDREVIRTVAGMSRRTRYYPRGRKEVLRRVISAQVDPRVFERPKSGFELPLNQWCLEQLQGDIDAIFGDRRLCRQTGLDPTTLQSIWRTFRDTPRAIYWTRIWALYVLLYWCDRHRVGL
jgi:asparagine synthase (glutamine-hydrolysing)